MLMENPGDELIWNISSLFLGETVAYLARGF